MIRIGIIGAGPNGAGHARYYAQSPRTQVVAIADPDGQRANALAMEIGAKAVADYREFLSEVDAVVVASPNFLHREQAVVCAEAGKHLYCEKPMGLSYGEATEIADAVRSAGVKSTVGFAVHFDPTIQTMEHYLRTGAIGELLSICSRRLMYIPPESHNGWRRDQRLSGGLLMEINIHELEWMMALGGEVESVYARTWAANPHDERSNDQIWVTLNFANGAVGMHEGSWLSPQPQFYRSVQGTAAGLCTDEWGSMVYLAYPGENRETVTMNEAFDLRGHFLDCIEHDATPVADVFWGLKVMAVAEAVLESAVQKVPIMLDDIKSGTKANEAVT